MTTPNWQHHSKKEQKCRLKPQALRQAKARRKAVVRKLTSKRPPLPFVASGVVTVREVAQHTNHDPLVGV